jgi:hypothetical protein
MGSCGLTNRQSFGNSTLKAQSGTDTSAPKCVSGKTAGLLYGMQLLFPMIKYVSAYLCLLQSPASTIGAKRTIYA